MNPEISAISLARRRRYRWIPFESLVFPVNQKILKKKIILNVSVWLNIMNDTHRYVMKKELGIPFFSSVAFQILLNQLCISCASSSNKFIYLLILESVQLLYQLIWRELVATLSSFQLPLPRWDHSSEMEYPHQLLELLC